MSKKYESQCKKPQDVSQYIEWLNTVKENSCSNQVKNYYETVITKSRELFLDSIFWSSFKKNYLAYDQEYNIKTGYKLFAQELQDIYRKPFKSVIDKTFRKNVLSNSDWPNYTEKKCLILPEDSFCYLNDCLRTTIVVKYLDGVEFVINKLTELANDNGIVNEHDFEAKDEGYYAAHFYLIQEFEVPKMKWDTKKVKIKIEIQVTTQIQDTIKKLTHRYYEDRRVQSIKKDVKWQWNYKDDVFVVNYMGHMLHYLEGMIMEIRDKEGKENE